MASKRSFSDISTLEAPEQVSAKQEDDHKSLSPSPPRKKPFRRSQRSKDPKVAFRDSVVELYDLHCEDPYFNDPNTRYFTLSIEQFEQVNEEIRTDLVLGQFVKHHLKICYSGLTKEASMSVESIIHRLIVSLFGKIIMTGFIWIAQNGSYNAKCYVDNLNDTGVYASENRIFGTWKKCWFQNDTSYTLFPQHAPNWHRHAENSAAFREVFENRWPALAIEVNWLESAKYVHAKIVDQFRYARGNLAMMMCLLLPYRGTHKKIEFWKCAPQPSWDKYEQTRNEQYLFSKEVYIVRDENGVVNPEPCTWFLGDFGLPQYQTEFGLSVADLAHRFELPCEEIADMFEFCLLDHADMILGAAGQEDLPQRDPTPAGELPTFPHPHRRSERLSKLRQEESARIAEREKEIIKEDLKNIKKKTGKDKARKAADKARKEQERLQRAAVEQAVKTAERERRALERRARRQEEELKRELEAKY